ncbi:MAG: PstC family ABC transporter permease, partial [Candidatus Odinarchaeia archaeon]
MVKFRVKKKIRVPKDKPLDIGFKIRKKSRIYEFIIEKIIVLCGLFAVIFVVFIFAYLLIESIPFFLEYDFISFIVGTDWNPTSPTSPSYGFVPLLYGTAIVTGVALLIAVPIGLISAMYISQIASEKEKEILKPLIEILAGIPSVVYGFFAFAVLSGVIQTIFGNYLRLNAFVAAVILGIMAIPTIVSISEDALTAV